ncbi:MAG: FliA/WhiG family RNA polymerase sigma factor [Archangiaceae bacterium]|nr:FliA/WhiG family RNA polymerase sigma factor [Archangiaceae bacterium]
MHRSSSAYLSAGRDDESSLVVKYRSLIDRVTRRVAARTGGAVSADELFSAGALGLIAAAQRFDPARDVSFETFVEYRIRGAVLDELRAMDPLPRRLRADTDKVKKARVKLEHELGREVTTEELAVATGKSIDDVASLQQVATPTEPLTELMTRTLEAEGAGAEDTLQRKQLVQQLSAEVGKLSQRQQMVLQMHYVEGLTYREIGSVLEVSEVRICQIHKEALLSLRSSLKEAA